MTDELSLQVFIVITFFDLSILTKYNGNTAETGLKFYMLFKGKFLDKNLNPNFDRFERERNH